MSLAGLAELSVQHSRRQKRGVLGATEGRPEPYSMYGEDWTDRATTKSDAFHGASANPAILIKIFYKSIIKEEPTNDRQS
jgi:predicted secreted hydrolase